VKDGEYYAMKQINLAGLREKEKINALAEV
jgi:hypothetical protein